MDEGTPVFDDDDGDDGEDGVIWGKDCSRLSILLEYRNCTSLSTDGKIDDCCCCSSLFVPSVSTIPWVSLLVRLEDKISPNQRTSRNHTDSRSLRRYVRNRIRNPSSITLILTLHSTIPRSARSEAYNGT